MTPETTGQNGVGDGEGLDQSGQPLRLDSNDLDNNGNAGKRRTTPILVYTLSLLATIGGFSFGYDIGIVAGSMLYMQPYFEETFNISMTFAAGAIGALGAGVLTHKIGRKRIIMMSSMVYLTGSFVIGLAPNEGVLVGRVMFGLGVGLQSVVVPIYVAEISPVHMRGRLVSLYRALMVFGISVGGILTVSFSYVRDYGRRNMLAMAAVPGTLQFVGFFFMPESPRWLVNRGRFEEAENVLKALRGQDSVGIEFMEIKRTVEEAKHEIESGSRFGHLLLVKIFTTPHVRRAMLLGCALFFFQQSCGIIPLIYYRATLLKMAGVSLTSSTVGLLVVMFDLSSFLTCLYFLGFVDCYGRRLSLIISVTCTAVGLVVLAVGLQLAAESNPTVSPVKLIQFPQCQIAHSTCQSCVSDVSCGFCYTNITDGTCLSSLDEEFSLGGRCGPSLPEPVGDETEVIWAYDYCPSDYTNVIESGMIILSISFEQGLRCLPTTINAEIYPLWARSTCNSLVTAIAWACNLVIFYDFLTMTEQMTIYGTYWLFAAITAVGVVVMVMFLPETKDKTLEEVEQLFMTPDQIEALTASRRMHSSDTDSLELVNRRMESELEP